MDKKLKIGLFGFGCVGQGLYSILESLDFPFEIVKIAVKDASKQRHLPSHYFTFDKHDILENQDINLVVELISDAEEAYQIVKKALLTGKNVVTANKKMLASHLKELVELSQKTGTSLLYEAAVCGAIPIIRTLANYYENEPIHKTKGIM